MGRERPREGNAEGPLSLGVGPDGKLVVLDQVNKRLVVSRPDGTPEKAVKLPARTPEDIAPAKDGKVAVLDRTHDKAVTIVDGDGNALGKLPLAPELIDKPGAVTGVFVDGDDVYAERKHGACILLGKLSGEAAKEKVEVPGRPSRDGTFFVSAGITSASTGRVYVAVVDKKTTEQRFTRELRLDMTTPGIALLETDKKGVIYFGVVLDYPGDDTVRIFCLDPLKGTTLGSIEVPATTQPEEQLRAFTVDDDGGIVHAYVEGGGVTYTRYECGK